MAAAFGYALTIDVEEWYHSCLVPDYVEPERRPRLAEELDRLLPELLALLAAANRSATFFVLGEVARRLPGRVREIAAAGHEVGCHGFHHLRVDTLTPATFRRSVADAKDLLEDLVGASVACFRAPEWSFRRASNPRLELVARAGFAIDSSLAPYPGAGRRGNRTEPHRLEWRDGGSLLEAPPLTFGGRWRVPASGWTGRIAPPRVLLGAARRHRERGGLPVWAVHPWELAERPCPGDLTGVARFVHETGRVGFGDRFRHVLDRLPWETLSGAAASALRADRARSGFVEARLTPPLPSPSPPRATPRRARG